MTPFAPSRRTLLAGLSASAAAVALPGCAPRPATPSAPGPAALLDRIAERLLALEPENATSLGIDTGARAALRGRLGDRSESGVASLARTLREDLAAVEKAGEANLDRSIQTSLAVVKSAYRVALDGFALPYGDVSVGGWRNTPYVVIQNVGAYLDTPRFLDADHPVKNAADAEAYLLRLAAFPAQLEGELQRLSATGNQGVVAPAFLLDKALAQIGRTIADAETGGGLVSSLVNRAQSIPGDWERRAAEIVRARVLPALQRQRIELAAQRTRASDTAGLWARPHGEEFYAWALRASTTTRMTPDEIHKEGFDQLKLLQDRMEPILQSLGFTKGTVGERMTALGHDPRFGFSNDDKGRAEIIALMQGKIGFIRGKLPLAFRRLARGNLEIRRLPPAEEGGAPGAYGGAGSIDGTVPGKIWLNLGDVSRHSKYSLPTLAFHEGIPGHVWQGEYANQLPLIRTLLQFNAYSEGWGLYAETLGDELGAYEGDPVGQLGYLQSIAFRACRLVVDTGIHAKRWTRDQAIDWFMQVNGSGQTEVSSEVDRYCSWAGQACGYKIGHSEILRQRKRAKAALGAKFDLRDFDSAVVEGGNVPLDVLAQNVERYVTGG